MVTVIDFICERSNCFHAFYGVAGFAFLRLITHHPKLCNQLFRQMLARLHQLLAVLPWDLKSGFPQPLSSEAKSSLIVTVTVSWKLSKVMNSGDRLALLL